MSIDCRPGCGACCIAPSISSASPKHPYGKAAGVRCLHLDENNLCELFNSDARPQVCISYQADIDSCASTNEQALQNLTRMENLTAGQG